MVKIKINEAIDKILFSQSSIVTAMLIYVVANELYQLVSILMFILETKLALPHAVATIAYLFIMVIAVTWVIKYPPLMVLVFILTIYIAHLTGGRIWLLVLLNVWPAIAAVLYCFYAKTYRTTIGFK